MTQPSIKQWERQVSNYFHNNASNEVVLGSPAVSGNLLIALIADNNVGGVAMIPGWNMRVSFDGGGPASETNYSLLWKEAAGGEQAIQWNGPTSARPVTFVAEIEGGTMTDHQLSSQNGWSSTETPNVTRTITAAVDDMLPLVFIVYEGLAENISGRVNQSQIFKDQPFNSPRNNWPCVKVDRWIPAVAAGDTITMGSFDSNNDRKSTILLAIPPAAPVSTFQPAWARGRNTLL